MTTPRNLRFTIYMVVLLITAAPLAIPQSVMSPADLLMMRQVGQAEVSPDGLWIAYTMVVPREASDEPGSSYQELYLLSTRTKEVRPFITGTVRVSSLAWSPDGSKLAFLMSRGVGARTQVWMMPVTGGEARPVTDWGSSVSSFAWHPSGTSIGFLAEQPDSRKERALRSKGYGFVFYEEDWTHRNLYLQEISGSGIGAPRQVSSGITIWSFEFAPDGKSAAVAASEKNLVDYSYMFQRIHILTLSDGTLRQVSQNEGKLGNFAFSPDGTTLAYAAAFERKDHAVSQAYAIPVAGGTARNLTPPNFRGHINWVGWKDNTTVLYRAGEATLVTLNAVKKSGGERTILLTSEKTGVIVDPPSMSSDRKTFAFVGDTPTHPGNLYLWKGSGAVEQLIDANPWLSTRSLGSQKVVQYRSRDGQTIEGLLIHPVGYDAQRRYPLVVLVHGGPESHYSNGWLTSYSMPGQVLAGKGYAVFYPNYRSSTGYGLDYAAVGYGDPAGKEFDDLADGITHLIEAGIADSGRVGLGGGSYGGYASAWFATYFTRYVKAVCMFVGISDLISKRGSTDIPLEELYVHSGKPLEEMWGLSLERSPIRYAQQSKTATLIMGGTADPRVHPSQSLELYRRMKMNGHPAVRLVQYPGEGHGNARQPGRIDVLYRILDWYDWYVKDAKPLGGPLPPLDISDRYGLELPE
jgi:dipeptidyl aminopeptidase/acylaminoacyl peptidase